MHKFFQLTLISLVILLIAYPSFAQQDTRRDRSSLVRLLQSKGIITEQEAARIPLSDPDDLERGLAELLLAKGVITREEYQQTFVTHSSTTDARLATAAAHVPNSTDPKPAPIEPNKSTGTTQTQKEGEVTTQ